jgi:DNA-binding NtrC family response regulator
MTTAPLRMLVADDSTTIQAYFADTVQRAPTPVEIVRALDGNACKEALCDGHVDLAFVDVHMPKISGLEALLMERHTCNKTFVTLMSTLPGEPKSEIARILKVYEFLTKPFSVVKIGEIVKTYLRVRSPTRALVVDDFATVRHVIAKILNGSLFNISIENAGDGDAAVAACTSGEFDIVFLDVNMPGLDGMQTLDLLRVRQPGAKVVMITGDHDVKHKIMAMKKGAFDFLFKPFNSVDVDRVLHNVFKLRQPLLWATADGAT